MSALVVSPHLDDAVLSFGGAIAQFAGDVTVATVFAGLPPEWSWPSPFDNASGFSSSREAVHERQIEDRIAVASLGARSLHLGFLDGQYGLDQAPAFMASVLNELLGAHDPVVFPLGLAHPDHLLVAKVCRSLGYLWPGRVVLLYADLPAARLWPSHVRGALRGWERAGWNLAPFEWRVDLDRKRRAYEEYRSQLRFPELAWENVTEERGWLARYEGFSD